MNVDELATMAGRLAVSDEHSELICRARQGDLEAFEQMMYAHDRQVYRVALRILGSVEDAQDAAQEVFLRLHRSLHRIDEDRALGAWLYRVTVNVCRDALRGRRTTVAIDESAAVSSEATPQVQSERQQMRQLVIEALARLPEK